MDLCDSNVWLALALSAHQHHAVARDWLAAVERPASVAFCRATQQTFLRLLTNATVLGAYGNPPLTNHRAWDAYDSLLADDRIVFCDEGSLGVEPRWRKLAARDTASPKLWMVAYLAAFSMAAGYRMVTTDRAYAQFAGLDLLLLGGP